jgi:hypothetical protein
MIKGLAVAGLILAGGVFAAPAGAATIYQNDFQGGSTANFSAGTINTAPGNGEKFLGVFSNGSSTTLTLTGLGGYSTIDISFDLLALGSLDGSGIGNCCGPDSFKLTYGATTLMDDTFSNNPAWQQTHGGAASPGGTGSDPSKTGLLGYNSFGSDHTYLLSFNNLAVTGGVAVFTFFGNTDQAFPDEGFGLDRILVAGTIAATPIPAALPLFVSGLGVLGWVARRQRRKAAAAA